MPHVQVILTESVHGVGRVGEIVRVASGYARNFLIPRGLAEHATEATRRRLDGQLRAKKISEAKEYDEAQAVAKDVEGVSLTIVQTAGERGRLFGSVTANDIAEALAEKGYPFDRRQIILNQPIREVGEYDVELRLHPQVSVPIPLDVRSTTPVERNDEDEVNEPEVVEADAAEEPDDESEA